MKRIVVFDLDGTLLNTIGDLTLSVNYALNSFGWPSHSPDDYKRFAGNGVNKLLERAIPQEEKNETNLLKLRQKFIEHYEKHAVDETEPFPGIPSLLDSLQELGIMIAVASNKYHKATVKVIKHFFPSINFVAIYGAREGVPMKPNPQVVFDILEKANIHDKSEVLYVGDSGVDMQTAVNAGVEACGITWGFRSRSELEEHNPLYIVDKAEEILNIVKQIK